MPTSNEVTAALDHLNKFSIVEEITQGANAYSYKAFHNVLGRQVFLKVFYYSEESAAEVLREPRTLVQATQANPTSENVVRLFDADVIPIGGDEYVCLQMEYIDGPSLLTLISNGLLGQQDAVRMASGILHGLSNLHSKNIVHRDLKPANIVLQQEIPKITDFGSAVVLADGQSEVPASKHSSLYVPPEGWETPSRFNFQSDIYQTFMILYELINGPLKYVPGHYVTTSLRRELAKAGVTYDDLDNFQKSKMADRGIAQLASRQRLLECGRAPQPYFSDKIKRLIKIGTLPEFSKRFSSADMAISKLSQVDVPNWRPLDNCGYFAPCWHGWDWKVTEEQQEVIVKKSRPSLNSFRRVVNCKVTSLKGAFDFIGAQ
ncbi:MAG: putative kinase [Candidatus Angelobacter sp.]|nr:putative kinase [Candidatus Angelobacter sp.]